MSSITLILSLIFVLRKCEIFGHPASEVEVNENQETRVCQVALGESVVLKCLSNDKKHNFLFWHLNRGNVIIGPANDYDIRKFKFEILSGNLTVRAVSKRDEGRYSCVSRGVNGESINIRSVDMVVQEDWGEAYTSDPNVNTIRILIVLIMLVLLSGGAYFAYQVWKDRYRYPSYLAGVDEDDDSGEEIFSAPGPSGTSTRTKSPPKDFDNVELSTDFKSILDTVNSK